MEEKNQQLHSEEIHDIITAPPSWIMRWGISVFFIVLTIVVGLSFLIRYPDLISTHTVIYSGNSSKVNSKIAGSLSKILVVNSEKVEKGQPLAFIEANVSHNDIIALTDSVQKLKDVVQRKAGGPMLSDIAALNKFKNSYQYLMPQADAMDAYATGPANTRNAFISQAEKMLLRLNRWKDMYIISATSKGRISMAGLLQQDQVVKAGQSLFYINSDNNAGFYGSMVISQRDIAKVKKGQQVLIKLSSYSFEDYGLIKGTIDSISELPLNDSVFVSHVKLNVIENKNIVLKNGLSAASEVVTRDITLMDRLIGNIKKAINGHN